MSSRIGALHSLPGAAPRIRADEITVINSSFTNRQKQRTTTCNDKVYDRLQS